MVAVSLKTKVILLRQLQESDGYGYRISKQVSERSSGNLELKEATLYTAFRRMEEAGLIRSYWGGEETGARRRYYTMTPQGLARLEDEKAGWMETRSILDKLILGEKAPGRECPADTKDEACETEGAKENE